jgi:ketosteroid isomerase-like protein
MKLLRPLALAALAVALHAGAARAQTGLYGLIPNENPANAPSMYTLRVKQEVTALIGSYKRAWDRDNAEDAAALYTRDGRIVIEGQDAQTRALVQQRLAELLPGAGPLNFSVMDFDTSGEMAFVSGQMSYGSAGQPGASAEYVLVARRGRNDAWLIRSLVLMPTAHATPAPAPAAAATPAPGGAASGGH